MFPVGSRRQAEAFAAVVDGRAPSTDPQLTALVAVVDRLRAEAADPSPAFRARLREQLMTAAETELRPAQSTSTAPGARTPATEPVKMRLRRRVGALAGAAVVAGSSISLVAASANALPGELLYPVKRAAEGIELMVRTGPAAEGTVQLEHATTRLVEVDALTRSVDAGSAQNTALVSATLEDFTEQATDGAADLITAFEQEQEPAAIEELNGFTADAAQQLQELAGVVPAGSGNELAGAADAVIDLAAQTAAACRSCAPVDDEGLTALLQSVDGVLADLQLPPAADARAPLVAPEDDTRTVAGDRSTVPRATAAGDRRPGQAGDGPLVTTREPESPGRGSNPPASGDRPSDGPVDRKPPVGDGPIDQDPADGPIDEDPIDKDPIEEEPGVPEAPDETTAPDVPTTDLPVVLPPLLGEGSTDEGDAEDSGPADALPGGAAAP